MRLAKEQLLDMFWDDIKARGFTFSLDGRDPWSQRWKRYIKNKKNGVEAEKYSQLESDQLKLEFRKNWCKGLYTEYQDIFGLRQQTI